MKMFSKSVFAAALIATSLVTQFASAAALPVETAPLSLVGDSEGWTSHFGRNFTGDDVAGKTFTDHYTFTVGGANLTTGSLTAKPLRSQDLYIYSFNVFSSAGALVVQGNKDNAGPYVPGQKDEWSLPDDVTLAGGNYYFEVTGLVLGKNSSYAAEMSLSPVPEAETYAMMMAGLGMVGFVARRRAAKKAA